MDPVAAHGGGHHHLAPPASSFYPFHHFVAGHHHPPPPFHHHFPAGQLHEPALLMAGGGVQQQHQAKQLEHVDDDDDSNDRIHNTARGRSSASGEAEQQQGAAAEEEQAPAVAAMRRRRPRGRPAGSKNKPKPPVIITRDGASALRAHVLEVAAGRDVVGSVARFASRRQVGVCVLSGTGAVSNVSICSRQQADDDDAVVTNLAGRFEILSLTGSFLPAPAAPPSATGLTVYLSGGHGQVVGGTVAGELMASTSVVIVAACFGNVAYEHLPLDDDEPHQLLPLPQGLAGKSSCSPPPPLPLTAHPHQQLLAPLGDHLPHHLLNGLPLPGDAYGWSAGSGSIAGRVAPY